MALSFKRYLDFVAKLSKQTKLSHCPPLADGMKSSLKGEFCNKNYLIVLLLDFRFSRMTIKEVAGG